jgi:hypothetical protein
MKKSINEEFKRMQKLAGLITENENSNEGSTFSTPEELADFLTKHKKEYLAEFPEVVKEYVYDKLFLNEETEMSEKDIEKYWMDPDFRFVVDYDSFDVPIVSIDWDGANDIDMSGYAWFRNNIGNEVEKFPLESNEFMGRKFWSEFN